VGVTLAVHFIDIASIGSFYSSIRSKMKA